MDPQVALLILALGITVIVVLTGKLRIQGLTVLALITVIGSVFPAI